MSVKPLDIPPWPQSGPREKELLESVLSNSQWGGFHPFVAEFEQRFADHQHSKHGIGAFNGTVSLELALTVLGIGPGDEVIIPAISFVSTATAVSRVGAVPVFVDIEPWSFNIDPQCILAALSNRTKAVLAVHFGGPLCRIDALTDICRQHKLVLLEDAAHAHGSEWNGRRAGSFGVAGSFSFQNGKVLCSGEGGLLTTSDDDFAAKARSIANQGRMPGQSFYQHFLLGSNFRLTGFQAAVLLAQLERLPDQIAHRTRMARLLKQLTLDVPGLVWQEEPPELTRSSYYLLPGRLQNANASRERLQQSLAAAGVPFTPFYPHTLYQNPLYRNGAECRVEPCPQAEAYLQDAFWLPHRVLLADAETIASIAAILRQALHS